VSVNVQCQAHYVNRQIEVLKYSIIHKLLEDTESNTGILLEILGFLNMM